MKKYLNLDSETIHKHTQAIWRMDSAKIVATLYRLVKDIGFAEDFAQDAFLAALEQWPVYGIPEKPTAWLITVGKRKAIDHIRHENLLNHYSKDIIEHPDESMYFLEKGFERSELTIKDDLLRLIFTICHPSLQAESQGAMALKILCGLNVEEIARAFLTTPSTISQRIVRAKRKLRKLKVQFDLPIGLLIFLFFIK